MRDGVFLTFLPSLVVVVVVAKRVVVVAVDDCFLFLLLVVFFLCSAFLTSLSPSPHLPSFLPWCAPSPPLLQQQKKEEA